MQLFCLRAPAAPQSCAHLHLDLCSLYLITPPLHPSLDLHLGLTPGGTWDHNRSEGMASACCYPLSSLEHCPLRQWLQGCGDSVLVAGVVAGCWPGAPDSLIISTQRSRVRPPVWV